MMFAFVALLTLVVVKCDDFEDISEEEMDSYGVKLPQCESNRNKNFMRFNTVYFLRELRKKLANGEQQNGNDPENKFPKAANMSDVEYDCGLEDAAYEFAMLCKNQTFTDFSDVGKNSIVFTEPSDVNYLSHDAFVEWWNTIEHNTALENLTPKPEDIPVISFLQMANEQTNKIGCAYYECSSSDSESSSTVSLACIYGEPHVGAEIPLYKNGTPCSYCRENCVDDSLCSYTALA